MKKKNCRIMMVCAAALCVLPALPAFGEHLTLGRALELALMNNTDIAIKTWSVANARGRMKSATAPTDMSVGSSVSFARSVNGIDGEDLANNYTNYGVLADRTDNRTLSSGFWAEKLFAMGLSAKVSVKSSRESSRVNVSEGTLPDAYGYVFNPEARNYAGADLELSLPLLKSFNDSIAKKNIESARYFLKQQEVELEEAVSRVILSVADAYWAYAMDCLQAANIEETGLRLKERRSKLGSLVEAGVVPGTEMVWMKVNISTNDINAILAKNSKLDSYTQLVRLIGADLGGAEALSVPPDVFPETLDYPVQANMSRLGDTAIAESIGRRTDVRSAEWQLRMAQLQKDIERIHARPDLNVSLSTGYRGTVYGNSPESLSGSFGENIGGINYSAGVSFSMHIPNNSSGARDSSEAEYRQAKLQLEMKKRDALLETRQNIGNLSNYFDALIQSLEVVRLHATLMTEERKFFDAGIVTVDKLYDLEEQAASAKAQYYNRCRSYLMAVLLMKYHSGTLAGIDDGTGHAFSTENLYRLPVAE